MRLVFLLVENQQDQKLYYNLLKQLYEYAYQMNPVCADFALLCKVKRPNISQLEIFFNKRTNLAILHLSCSNIHKRTLEFFTNKIEKLQNHPLGPYVSEFKGYISLRYLTGEGTLFGRLHRHDPLHFCVYSLMFPFVFECTRMTSGFLMNR